MIMHPAAGLFPEPDRTRATLFRARAGGDVLEAAVAIIREAPPRRYETPGGRRMSVAMTNCGTLGWYSDHRGYRYVTHDPETGRPWPSMPPLLKRIAAAAATEAGYARFEPEACLVNVYDADSRMGMHQDRDEHALDQPIVSVSFGRAAWFRLGGPRRTDPSESILLEHGDVLVFGGAERLAFHGVTRLAGVVHWALPHQRINLTFRRVAPA